MDQPLSFRHRLRAFADRQITRLAGVQLRHPWWVLALIFLTAIPAGWLALQLDLRTDFAELLPENKDSVVEMHRVRQHLASASTLSIVAQGEDSAALMRFVDTLAPKLRAMGPEWVVGVDDGIRDMQQFVERNKLLFAPYDDLEKIHDEVVARYEYEVARRMDLLDSGAADEAGEDSFAEDEFDQAESERAAAKKEAAEKRAAEKKAAALALAERTGKAPPPAADAQAAPAAAAGSDGTAKPAGPPPSLSELRQRVDELMTREKRRDPHPNGYYMSEDGKTIVVLVRTPVEVGGLTSYPEMRRRVEALVAETNPASFDPAMRVNYTGDFITGAEEYKSIRDDLLSVGAVGVLMVLGVVLLFFLHLRSLLLIALTIGMGILWTFGLAKIAPGYLNTATGFLVSIVAGNGINFSIIYLARYLEARRERISVPEALITAHRDTWLATLAASSAAIVAYGSLAVTDFKGFKHFGIIGGAGMLLCWLATYLLLPSLLALMERHAPMHQGKGDWREKLEASYGRGFAWITARIPRLIVGTAVVTGLLGLVLGSLYTLSDPMESDMRKLRNESKTRSVARELSGTVDDVVGRIGQEGMAILVDRLDQVAPLKTALDKRRDAVLYHDRPFDRVVTLFDLLPSRQEEKAKLIETVDNRLRKAHQRGFLVGEDWTKIEELLPKGRVVPLTIQDLPEKMARPFTEKDGTRGRIVYIVPRSDRSVWNSEYLKVWAASFREVKLPSGEVIKGSGRAVIFADMLQSVNEDAPKAILASGLGTLLVILVFFGLRRSALGVLGTLLLGCAWLASFLFFKGVRLNFLNFIALPITLGIGADYAINMVRRYEIDGAARLRRIIVQTGGAVILCSLTTVLGYIALMFSNNLGIASFGLVAATGELACLLAALLVLPAALFWIARRRGVVQEEVEPSPPPPPALPPQVRFGGSASPPGAPLN